MAIRNIKRWQWIAGSLLVGLLLGYFQQLPTENWQKRFGDTITQDQFEKALSREQNGLRWFRDIVVYPERIEVSGQSVPVTIVTGNYFNGKMEMQDGHRVAIWKPRCFIAEGPFDPIVPLANVKNSDTVFTYLASVKGVTFSYAWWKDSKWAIALWTAGSFLVIGLIWPTAINLILFGSILRPREEKGIDLSKAQSTATPDRTQVSGADLAAVARMGDEMEATFTPPDGVTAAKVGEKPNSPPELTGTALEASAEEAREAKDFGQDRDDFYPTERHRPHSE